MRGKIINEQFKRKCILLVLIINLNNLNANLRKYLNGGGLYVERMSRDPGAAAFNFVSTFFTSRRSSFYEGIFHERISLT